MSKSGDDNWTRACDPFLTTAFEGGIQLSEASNLDDLELDSELCSRSL